MKWYVDNLVCPRDKSRLETLGSALRCRQGHQYPVVDGVPVMLVDELAATIESAPASVAAARATGDDPLFLETLSLSDDERRGIAVLAKQGSAIDPVVAYLVAATNGLMYKHLVGRLNQYPIPSLPMSDGGGRRLLDVGCSWGRWTLSAVARGYDAVGVDPSLGAILAARRVAAELHLPAHYVVADARCLPFPPGSFDAAFSYSVVQHFSYEDAALTVGEISRVVRPGSCVKVQLPTKYGLRCLYHQARRGFRTPHGFDVRYWTRARIRKLFASTIGPTNIAVDGYFGIGLQPSDRSLMTPMFARVLAMSEMLKRASATVRPLQWAADSVFVEARKS